MATVETDESAGPGAGPADSGGEKPQSQGLSERALGRIFLTPSFAVMALIALAPILYAMYESLFDFTFLSREEFVGFENYATQLTDGRFWSAVWTTILFTVTSVGLEFAIGLGFALIMNAAFAGRGVVRATILLPWVIPTVIAGQIWRYLLTVNPGYVNEWLAIGNFDWLGAGGSMFWAVVIADVWKTAPFVALLLLAGLQTIPGDLYEAARVDGASWGQRFRRITMPLLKPAIVVALLFRSVDALRIYDLANIMTSDRLETLSVLTQRRIFTDPTPGEANALSVLTFIIIMGIGLVFISLMRGDVLGDGKGDD